MLPTPAAGVTGKGEPGKFPVASFMALQRWLCGWGRESSGSCSVCR